MKKLAILSIVTASLLFIGCGQGNNENAKGEQTTMAQKATNAVKTVKETTTDIASKTAQKTGELTQKAIETTSNIVKTAKDKVSNLTESAGKKSTENSAERTATTPKANNSESGAPEAYKKCAGCHGKDGKMKALGKSEVIAGQSKDDLIAKIKEYKAGTRNVAGMGALMKGQVASFR